MYIYNILMSLKTKKSYYEANKQYVKNYVKINRDKIKAYQHKYYAENRIEILQKQKDKKKNNTEDEKLKIKNYWHNYYLLNREKLNKKNLDNYYYKLFCSSRYTHENNSIVIKRNVKLEL